MISRRTIFSFLFMLLLFLCIRAYVINHRDNCDRYEAGDRSVPASEFVHTGTRIVAMPCGEWMPRQPIGVQLASLADFAIVAVFVLSVWGDWKRWAERRRAGILF